MKVESRQEAARRIRIAMARLEAVALHLEGAAQSISVVIGPGIGMEWEKVRVLTDLARASARRLEERLLAGCIDLDDLTKGAWVETANLKVM